MQRQTDTTESRSREGSGRYAQKDEEFGSYRGRCASLRLGMRGSSSPLRGRWWLPRKPTSKVLQQVSVEGSSSLGLAVVGVPGPRPVDNWARVALIVFIGRCDVHVAGAFRRLFVAAIATTS